MLSGLLVKLDRFVCAYLGLDHETTLPTTVELAFNRPRKFVFAFQFPRFLNQLDELIVNFIKILFEFG